MGDIEKRNEEFSQLMEQKMACDKYMDKILAEYKSDAHVKLYDHIQESKCLCGWLAPT